MMYVAAISSSLTDALSTAFTGVQTDVTTIVSSALPAALGIMGISVAITVGIKLFKRFLG